MCIFCGCDLHARYQRRYRFCRSINPMTPCAHACADEDVETQVPRALVCRLARRTDDIRHAYISRTYSRKLASEPRHTESVFAALRRTTTTGRGGRPTASRSCCKGITSSAQSQQWNAIPSCGTCMTHWPAVGSCQYASRGTASGTRQTGTPYVRKWSPYAAEWRPPRRRYAHTHYTTPWRPYDAYGIARYTLA